jgi:hypothetical protein
MEAEACGGREAYGSCEQIMHVCSYCRSNEVFSTNNKKKTKYFSVYIGYIYIYIYIYNYIQESFNYLFMEYIYVFFLFNRCLEVSMHDKLTLQEKTFGSKVEDKFSLLNPD